jgi:DNA-directed RNA polymerase specialized sigma24 family protein
MLTNDEFAAWWRTIEVELRRTLRRSRADAQEIDDICQDTAALAWRRREDIGDSQTDLLRWAVVVGRRLLWRRHARAAREQPTDLEALLARDDAGPADTERIVVARSQWERVSAAIPSLPSSERAAILGKLRGTSTGKTKREQDAAAAALARARRRLGRLGVLGSARRWRGVNRPPSVRKCLALAVGSGVAAAAVVLVPIAVLTMSLSSAPPLQAYAQPLGYSREEASRAGHERNAAAADDQQQTGSPADERDPEDVVRGCVESIVTSARDIGGDGRWASIAKAVTEQSGPVLAGRLSRISDASAGPDRVAAAAELKQQAEGLLDDLSLAETRLVCREVRRAARLPSGTR